MKKFTDNSFTFNGFSQVDKKSLVPNSPEEYFARVQARNAQKYMDAFSEILRFFRQIQSCGMYTENDSYKVFSAAILNQLGESAEKIANDKAAEKILDAIQKSVNRDSLKESLRKMLEDSFPEGTGSGGSISGLQEFFDANVDNIQNFVEMVGDHTGKDIRSFLELVFQTLRKRFEAEVASLVDKGYRKALDVSEELREDDERNQDAYRRNIILGLLHDVRHDKIVMGKRNRTFLGRQLVLLEKTDRVNRNIAKIGTSRFEELLLENLKSTNKKFSEFELGVNLVKRGWYRMFMNPKRLEYLQRQAEEVKENLETAKDKRVGFVAGPGFWRNVLPMANKAASMALLPAVLALNKVFKSMPSIRKIGKFVSGVMVGIRNSVKFVVNTLGGIAKAGIKLAKGLLTAPFNLIGGIFGFVNRPFGKALAETLSSDEGAFLLGTIAAFAKVFVVDPIVERLGVFGGRLEELKKRLREYGNVARYVFVTSWKDRILGGQNWDLSRDEDAISRFMSGYKGAKDGKNYPLVVLYGALAYVHKANLWLKRVYDTWFPFKVMTEAEKTAEDFKSRQEEYGRKIRNDNLKMDVAAYQKLALGFIRESLGDAYNKGIVQSFGASVAAGEKVVSQAMDYLIGGSIEIGSSLVGGAIGSLFAPPLGTIIGALIGQGVGMGINWLRGKAKMNAKAADFALQHLRNRGERMRERRRVTTDVYVSLQDALRTGSETEPIGEAEMERRIGELERAVASESDPGRRKELRIRYEKVRADWISLQSQRARGMMTQAEYDQFLRLKSMVETDVNETTDSDGNKRQGWIKPTNSINSFEVPFMNNGVMGRKIEGYDKDETVRENINTWRYIIGNNMKQLMDAYESDEFTGSISPQTIADYQREMYDEVFRDGKFQKFADASNSSKERGDNEFEITPSYSMKKFQVGYKYSENDEESARSAFEWMYKEHPNNLITYRESGFLRHSYNLFPMNSSYTKFVRKGLGVNGEYDFVELKDLPEEGKKAVAKKRDKDFQTQFQLKFSEFIEDELGRDDINFNSMVTEAITEGELGRTISDMFRNNLNWFDSNNIRTFFDIVESNVSQESHYRRLKSLRAEIGKKIGERGQKATAVKIGESIARPEFSGGQIETQDAEMDSQVENGEDAVAKELNQQMRKKEEVFDQNIESGRDAASDLVEECRSWAVPPAEQPRKRTEAELQADNGGWRITTLPFRENVIKTIY